MYVALRIESEDRQEWYVMAGCRRFLGLDTAREHWDPAKHGEPWKCRWVRRRLDELDAFVEERAKETAQ